jgi:N-hydroxyarylamine O-acetyltransferase
MNIQAYLDRIDYHGSLEPTAETLRALHVAHLLAVPFENLNIGMGWPIVLDQDALFEKIVLRRRGGFCYELNGLFAPLLGALGFDVTLLSAGVARAGGGFGPDFDHLTLLVTTDHRPPTTVDQTTTRQETGDRRAPAGTLRTTDNKLRTNLQSAICNLQSTTWLADVGFGDSFREPLRFEEHVEQRQGEHAYRIVGDGEHLVLQRRELGLVNPEETGDQDAWEPQYRFTTQPRRPVQFVGMCHYHQTSPQSSFTRRRICTRATPDGRITLSDMRLIVTNAGERRQHDLADEAEVQAALREHFGIELDSKT